MKTLMSLTGERAQSYLSYDRMKMYVHGQTLREGAMLDP